jgi:hypothetical protein
MQGDNSWWSQMYLVASNYQRTWTDLTLPYAHGWRYPPQSCCASRAGLLGTFSVMISRHPGTGKGSIRTL